MPFTEIDVRTSQLLSDLNAHGFLKQFEKPQNYDSIWDRILRDVRMAQNKEDIFRNSKFFKYSSFMSEICGAKEDELMQEYIAQICHVLLALFEHIKRYLRGILELDRLEINEFAMYGTILNRISEKLRYDQNQKEELNKLFLVDIRNVMAHDTWYWKNEKFTYLPAFNEPEKQLDVNDFFSNIAHVTRLKEYLERNYQRII